MDQTENSGDLVLELRKIRVRPSATGDMERSDSHAEVSLPHCATFVYE